MAPHSKKGKALQLTTNGGSGPSTHQGSSNTRSTAQSNTGRWVPDPYVPNHRSTAQLEGVWTPCDQDCPCPVSSGPSYYPQQGYPQQVHPQQGYPQQRYPQGQHHGQQQRNPPVSGSGRSNQQLEIPRQALQRLRNATSTTRPRYSDKELDAAWGLYFMRNGTRNRFTEPELSPQEIIDICDDILAGFAQKEEEDRRRGRPWCI